MKLTIGDSGININLSLPGGGVTLLTIAFVVLKVLGYLDWTWLWVLSPLWIGASLMVLFLIVVGIVILIIARS